MNQAMLLELRRASDREQEAYDFYVNMVRNVDDGAAKDLFRQLAVEEMRHTALLKAVQRKGNLEEAKAEVQAKHPEDGIIIRPGKQKGSIRLAEAFSLSIRKEEAAIEMYSADLKLAEDGQLKELFTFLIKEESRHKSMLIDARSKAGL